LDTYNLKGAKVAVVAMGTISSTARVVIDELKKKGRKVGLIRIKCYRPFPSEDLAKAAKGVKTLVVIDRDISIGYEGAVASDVKSALFGRRIRINTYIAGLGGRDVTPKDIKYMITKKSADTEWINTK
jgi:pyruvate ferredoxin oxidoreductase alpha subunit